MVDFTTTILQFGEYGDKTGWTYIEIPADISQQIKPGEKRAYRVKGFLDNFEIAGKSLLPHGQGVYIFALNEPIRKAIRKERGAILRVRLEHDADFKLEMPDDLQECFDYEQPEALDYFNRLSKSHRGYFIKWINDAKTEQTRANRIALTLSAAVRRMDYGAMLREQKKLRE
ncbi:YdeI/OmpD-associated family protein [Mucilaginibacter sp.]|uniref:YdeI/OmpD-associated family protein n=1 Tax=Mucilaginibacter sp. TaxID=1882438 RepID=UPI0035BC59FF